jgi:hypothetical protein
MNADIFRYHRPLALSEEAWLIAQSAELNSGEASAAALNAGFTCWMNWKNLPFTKTRTKILY